MVLNSQRLWFKDVQGNCSHSQVLSDSNTTTKENQQAEIATRDLSRLRGSSAKSQPLISHESIAGNPHEEAKKLHVPSSGMGYGSSVVRQKGVKR